MAPLSSAAPGNFRCRKVFHPCVRFASFFALGLLGCAAAPVPAPARAPAPAAIPPVLPTETATPSAPPRARGPNRCLPNGPPKARAAKKIYAASTCVDHRTAERALARKLAKAFDKSVDRSTVDVTFDCDPLTSELEELVLETGSGHGGGLQIWRLAKKEGQPDFDVLGIANVGYYAPLGQGELPVRLGRGRIAAATLEKALATARPALTARVRELEPPPLPNGLWGRKFSTSSGNFHLYFRLTDGTHELVRHFTGYPGSSDQPRYMGLQEAHAVVAPLLEKIPLAAATATEDERDFFVQSFLRAAPRFDDDFAWWVRDRYVALAEYLGTPELVPTLVGVLESALREADRETDAERKRTVLERRLGPPLASLARITGWDPRKDHAGAARDPLAVAREVIAECRVDSTAGGATLGHADEDTVAGPVRPARGRERV